MASQADLAKIGSEGFDLIDQFYDPPRRSTVKAAKRVPDNYNDHVKREEQVISSKEAAYKYGGVMVTNYPNKTRMSCWGKFFRAFKF